MLRWQEYLNVGVFTVPVRMLFMFLLLDLVVKPRARAACHTASPQTCQVLEHKFYSV